VSAAAARHKRRSPPVPLARAAGRNLRPCCPLVRHRIRGCSFTGLHDFCEFASGHENPVTAMWSQARNWREVERARRPKLVHTLLAKFPLPFMMATWLALAPVMFAGSVRYLKPGYFLHHLALLLPMWTGMWDMMAAVSIESQFFFNDLRLKYLPSWMHPPVRKGWD
jgi:hypothetical protein